MVLNLKQPTRFTEDFVYDKEIDRWSEEDATENYSRDHVIRIMKARIVDKLEVDDFIKTTARRYKLTEDDIKETMASKEIKRRAVNDLIHKIREECRITITVGAASKNINDGLAALKLVAKSRKLTSIGLKLETMTNLEYEVTKQ